MTVPALATLLPSSADEATFDPRAEALFYWLVNQAIPAFNADITALNLNSTTDTSTSSVLIGTGSKSFTVSAGKSFQPGMYLAIASTAAPSTNSMVVQITSYNAGTGALDVKVLSILGSGTIAAWVLSQSSPPTINYGKSVFINGDFRINQAGYVSGATLAAGLYGHDGWKAGASGGNYTFTQSKSSTTITIAAGKSLIQIAEDANVEGGNYIVSWTGTAVARVGVNTVTPAGNFAVSPITLTGQTAGTTFSVEFAGAGAVGTGSVASATAGTLVKVQPELGTVPTPFERRQIRIELALCQAYYLEVFGGYSGPCVNGNTNYGYTQIPIGMYGTPTITYLTTPFATSFPATAPLAIVLTGNVIRAAKVASATAQSGEFVDKFSVASRL